MHSMHLGKRDINDKLNESSLKPIGLNNPQRGNMGKISYRKQLDVGDSFRRRLSCGTTPTERVVSTARGITTTTPNAEISQNR